MDFPEKVSMGTENNDTWLKKFVKIIFEFLLALQFSDATPLNISKFTFLLEGG